MNPHAPQVVPITGVIFDFHHTLVHGGDAGRWLDAAWRRLGRDGSPSTALGADHADVIDFLDHVWDHARDVDPDNERDLDSHRHREVFLATVGRVSALDPDLVDALYTTVPDVWEPYDDTRPVLTALRIHGIRVALLSNVGYDLRPVVERTGIAPLLDGMAMSQELGVVKPDPRIFQAALDIVGRPATEVLMVGDAWRDDGAGAALGIRTLILPRTDGAVHGLELVLRIVGVRSDLPAGFGPHR